MKRKICVVTATRAEFGLLYWIIKDLHEDSSIELQLIVTGTHLSPEFGFTCHEVNSAGFPIAKKIEILLSSDSPVGITKSMGLAMISFAEAFAELTPDLVLILGDRFEMLSVASAALVAKIPIAHIHGGETTEGAVDEAVRHSITKMAHIHFTATEDYRNRVIQLGENPDRVFNFGTPGLDNLINLTLLDRNELEGLLNFKFGNLSALITFHPETLGELTPGEQFGELLEALQAFEEMHLIFTKPNADTGGRSIINKIDDFVLKNSARSVAFTSMGQLKYLSALQHVDIVIGNSSSGIIEAPSLKVPTVNIGDRQKGRLMAASVLNSRASRQEIINTIKLALSEKHIDTVKKVKNPYGEPGASSRITTVIKSYNLKGLLKKKFCDINQN